MWIHDQYWRRDTCERDDNNYRWNAEQGYNVGDKLFANPGREAGYNQGIAVVPDTTNLNIRFGQTGTNVFTGLNKTTGASVNFTNTKWTVIFRAWAF